MQRLDRSWPEAEGVVTAARTITPQLQNTPQFISANVSELLGCDVLVKVETMNPLRSFKGRGTDYVLATRFADASAVVTASAGNFGQGLAYTGRMRGVRVVVFAARSANPRKLAQMELFGADVRLAGDDLDEAKDAARAFAAAEDVRFVEDGAWPEIAEGAGTIAREVTEAGYRPDVIVVPVGNGALITGISCWMRTACPDAVVVGVCAAGAPAMYESWRRRTVTSTEGVDTIADGIAIREPITTVVDQLPALVDDMVLVEDADLLLAMGCARQELGLVLEPSAAAGLAGARAVSQHYPGALMCVPMCGGFSFSRRSR